MQHTWYYAAYWSARRDSNPQPPAYHTGTLPIELRALSTTKFLLKYWAATVQKK